MADAEAEAGLLRWPREVAMYGCLLAQRSVWLRPRRSHQCSASTLIQQRILGRVLSNRAACQAAPSETLAIVHLRCDDRPQTSPHSMTPCERERGISQDFDPGRDSAIRSYTHPSIGHHVPPK